MFPCQRPSLPLSSVDADGFGSCLEDLELNSLLRQVGGFVAAFSEGGYGTNADTAATKTHALSQLRTASCRSRHEPVTNDDVGLPALKPQLIQTETVLDALVQRLMACTDSSLPVAFDTETTDLNPFRAELVGIGICWERPWTHSPTSRWATKAAKTAAGSSCPWKPCSPPSPPGWLPATARLYRTPNTTA